MIRFDKIKVIAPITVIDGYENNSCFETTIQGDNIVRYKFSHNHPALHVIVTPKEEKMSIEFTGKILGEHYPELISQKSIRECFERVNRMGLFHIDTDTILQKGEIIQCDVTCDLKIENPNKIHEIVLTHINSPKWAIQQYSGGGIVVSKTVKTIKYKRRLSIYNKNEEMRLKSNIDFVTQFQNSEEITNYFRDKIRFELNLTSKKAIRDALKTSDNYVMSVLTSMENPIRSAFYESIILPKEERHVKKLRDFERQIVLEHFNYDLSKIRSNFSKFYKDANGLNKMMKIYRELILLTSDYSWLECLLEQAA